MLTLSGRKTRDEERAKRRGEKEPFRPQKDVRESVCYCCTDEAVLAVPKEEFDGRQESGKCWRN